MLILLGFLLTIYFGYLLSVLFVNRMHPLERIGASYLLGIGLLTLGMFVFSDLGLRITLVNTMAVLFGATILLQLLVLVKKGRVKIEFPNIKSIIRKLSIIEKILIGIICFLFVVSIALTIYWPIYQWDALALYDFRAKIIYQTGYFVQIAKNYSSFIHYPLLTSLSHTWVYLLGGSNPKFVYSLFFISFTLIYYGTLRKYVSRQLCLASTLIFTSTPIFLHHSTFAYTNLPYVAYLVSGLFFLFVFITKENIGYLVLSAIMLALSRWTRFVEPFWLSGVVAVLLYALYRKKIVAAIIFGIILSILNKPWVNFSTTFTTTQPSSAQAQVYRQTETLFRNIDLDRARVVAVYLFENVVLYWRPILYVFLIAIIIGVKKLRYRKSTIILVMIIFNFGLLYIGTYLLSLYHSYWNQIPDSARRLAMFFFPLFIYYSTLVFEEVSVNKLKTIK